MKKALKIYLFGFILFNLVFFTTIKTQPNVHGVLMRITRTTTPATGLVLDNQGNLHERKSDNSKAMEKTAAAIISMKSAMSNNVNVIVAPTLSKNLPGTVFKSISYDTNISTDLFIETLKNYNISILDYRTLISEETKISDLFYLSDSTMTVKSSFWAFQEFVKFFNREFKANLDPEEVFTSQENYLIQTYPGAFLGSYTKQMGQYYLGADDYSVIYPNIETRYQLMSGTQQVDGDFVSVLLNLDKLNEPMKMNETYLASIKSPAVIVNQSAPTNERIFVIYDKSSTTFVSFLTTVFREVHLVDIGNVPSNTTDYIAKNDIRNVLFAISNQDAYFDSIVK